MRKVNWNALAADCGLQLDRITQNRHFKLYTTAPDGRKAIFTTAVTPGDHRGILNTTARMRRFANGIAPTC